MHHWTSNASRSISLFPVGPCAAKLPPNSSCFDPFPVSGGRHLDRWAYWKHVQLDFSRPGKPTDDVAIESFHNSFRRECLTQHYLLNLTEAQDLIEQYR